MKRKEGSPKPKPPTPQIGNKLSIATCTGSYFEYVVRNIILNTNGRNLPNVSLDVLTNPICNVEKIVYFYHLQMMHVDLMWVQNWIKIHKKNVYPSIFELPSRAVRYFYDIKIDYDFGDEKVRTLDSHRLFCDECESQYEKHVNHLHSHNVNIFVCNEPMFERRSRLPGQVGGVSERQRFDIELENVQRYNLLSLAPTNNRQFMDEPSTSYRRNVNSTPHIQAGPMIYATPTTTTTTITTTTATTLTATTITTTTMSEDNEWTLFKKRKNI